MKQQCPNCLWRVDVSIYVSGQRIRCPRCHVPFEVSRESMLSVVNGAESREASPVQAAVVQRAERSPAFEMQTTPS